MKRDVSLMVMIVLLCSFLLIVLQGDPNPQSILAFAHDSEHPYSLHDIQEEQGRIAPLPSLLLWGEQRGEPDFMLFETEVLSSGTVCMDGSSLADYGILCFERRLEHVKNTDC